MAAFVTERLSVATHIRTCMQDGKPVLPTIQPGTQEQGISAALTPQLSELSLEPADSLPDAPAASPSHSSDKSPSEEGMPLSQQIEGQLFRYTS